MGILLKGNFFLSPSAPFLLHHSDSRHTHGHGQPNDRKSRAGSRAAVCSRQTGLCCYLRTGKYSAYR